MSLTACAAVTTQRGLINSPWPSEGKLTKPGTELGLTRYFESLTS